MSNFRLLACGRTFLKAHVAALVCAKDGRMSYHATNADLPEIFWPGGKSPKPKAVNASLRAEVAAVLHYPAIDAKRSLASVRDAARELRKRDKKERRIYVKAEKKEQMREWLRALAPFIRHMRPNEAQFCRSLLAKFGRYGRRTRWITLRQYEWAKYLAVDYVPLPERVRAA